MFKLEQEPRFWWKTDILVPNGETKSTVSCELQFRTGMANEAEALASYVSGKLPEAEWISQKVVGWKDVGDQDGNPLPFTPENLARFLAIDYVRSSVVHAYLKAINGLAHVRKN